MTGLPAGRQVRFRVLACLPVQVALPARLGSLRSSRRQIPRRPYFFPCSSASCDSSSSI